MSTKFLFGVVIFGSLAYFRFVAWPAYEDCRASGGTLVKQAGMLFCVEGK